MPSPTVDAERSGPWPHVEELVAHRAGDRDASLQDPFPDGEPPRPAPEVVLATQLVNRRFDQDPPQPRRPGFGDAAAPLPPATAFDAWDQPGVTRQVRPIRKAGDDADFGTEPIRWRAAKDPLRSFNAPESKPNATFKMPQHQQRRW